ncbi:MAG: hypothetical protein U0401_02790 [Anaerolineae bacterium]
MSGFPLDDAWIHQTYARNLARSGQLAFIPGIPSAGSTAPLWSFLLSLGYLLGIPFQIWTYGLGIICLGLTGWTTSRLARQLFPEQSRLPLWVGLFCLAEWHLIWASVSGMETILFVWLSLFLVERYLQSADPQDARPTWAQSEGRGTQGAITNNQLLAFLSLGLLGGLLTLTRPEGLGLVGLIGMDMVWRWYRRELKGTQGTEGFSVPSVPFSSYQFPQFLLLRLLSLGLGVILLLTPYIAFHLWNTGQPFPNTFYAKQAEYRIVLESYPLWGRLFGNFGESVETVQGVFRVIFIGAQILLLPGLLFAAWLTIKQRRTSLLIIWLWWLGFLLLYGLRLPVTYQHGRYQIPAIPWVILLGLWGTAGLLDRLPRRSLSGRVIRPVVLASLALLLLAFTFIGARAYGRDVRFIQSEMVAVAYWLRDNTVPEALIAAHDIGAIGYFAERPLIDLAGLITPEIIPIIRDEPALFDFINARRAEYLVTFPSWYPQLTRNPRLVPLYSTQTTASQHAGSDNMTVYQIK